MRWLLASLLVGFLWTQTGCDMKLPENRRNVNPGMFGVSTDTPETLAQPDAPAAGASTEAAPASEGSPAESPSMPVAEKPAAAEDSTLVRAEVGVGRQGRYGGDFITTPVSNYFTMQQRLTFEARIPHAMQLYEATNGQAPQSHEEFMREIIQANNIALPPLPHGEEYVYNPQTKELCVRRPNR